MAHIAAVERHMKAVEMADKGLQRGGYMLGMVYGEHGKHDMAL